MRSHLLTSMQPVAMMDDEDEELEEDELRLQETLNKILEERAKKIRMVV